MNDHRRLEMLRMRHRSLWDDYKAVARRNSRLLLDGQQPTPQQIADERAAVIAVDRARHELLAAISLLHQ
jgi:hypothetical protein